MDKTKTIHLSVEEQVAMEHIKEQKEELDYRESDRKFFMYISEDQIREIVRDELSKQRPRGYNNYREDEQ